MRWTNPIALSLAAALGAFGSAEAGEMAVGQMDGVKSQRDCMERARAAAQRFRDQFGASGVGEASWTVYVFNGQYERFDFVLMCPKIEGETAVFVVVHGPDGSTPLEVLKKVQQSWR